ncbi:arginase family protein [Paracidovorax anthurii]|uniref:Arginase family protein n=1 Tax=Paracidovorax anthurii TaxID=78229 RepID=A0A328ZIT8_9BURK|nr:arginase family protein [Paracidovorax anthurii]RAR85789.1 arginase family protein [Paracidovorax anthurii]
MSLLLADPMVLDLDGSVAELPGERRLVLADAWQEPLRMACSLRRMRAFGALLDECLPTFPEYGPVFTGSGDFHHLSWLLIARSLAARGYGPKQPVRVVVLDNHPDNMWYPFGVHCGSWVRHVAMMPEVSHVHVVGITSADIGLRRVWEHSLDPLWSGRLTYWSSGVDVRWSRWAGLGRRFHDFPDADAVAEAFCRMLEATPGPTYLSIDKDVFSPEVLRTHWDQGRFMPRHAESIVDTLAGSLVGCDVTGDVSVHRYQGIWKRWLSAVDGQDIVEAHPELAEWQAMQGSINLWLLRLLQQAL